MRAVLLLAILIAAPTAASLPAPDVVLFREGWENPSLAWSLPPSSSIECGEDGDCELRVADFGLASHEQDALVGLGLELAATVRRLAPQLVTSVYVVGDAGFATLEMQQHALVLMRPGGAHSTPFAPEVGREYRLSLHIDALSKEIAGSVEDLATGETLSVGPLALPQTLTLVRPNVFTTGGSNPAEHAAFWDDVTLSAP